MADPSARFPAMVVPVLLVQVGRGDEGFHRAGIDSGPRPRRTACHEETEPSSGMILGMTTRTTPKSVVGVEFQMSPEQREALKAEAFENNVSMQELLELRVFGELRPRLRRRRRGVSEGQELLSA